MIPLVEALPAVTPPLSLSRLRTLTQLSDLQDLAQHSRQLDGAASKRTLVFIFPAAVLQHDLGGKKTERATERSATPGSQTYH